MVDEENDSVRHPIWAMNMLTLHQWNDPNEDWQIRLLLMQYWCPFIQEWLDKTMVKGNPDAQALVRVLFKIWRRMADWSKIKDGHDAICSVDKRLRGLVNDQRSLRKPN